MKTKYFAILAVAALFVGCAKEVDVTEKTPEGKHQVTITANILQTKSTVTDAGLYSWSSDEMIAVAEEGQIGGAPIIFDVDDADAGTFTGTVTTAPVFAVTPTFVASNFTTDGGQTIYDITFGNINNYVPGTTNALMVGALVPNSAYKFEFRHAAAVIKVPVENVPAGTAKVKLTMDKKITGKWESVATVNPIPEITPESAALEGENYVVLTLKDAITTPNTSADFYFPVPVNTYTSFQFELLDANNTRLKGVKKTGLNIKLDAADLFITPTINNVAPAGTVLFDEPFTGFAANDVPDAPSANATVYGSASVAYVCKDGESSTKIYEDTIAGGESPELLVSKTDGEFAISGLPTGLNTKVTVTWYSNNTNIKLFYDDNQQTAELIGNHYQSVLDVSGASFNITFKNNASKNGRLDNIHVVAGEPVVLEKVATPSFSPAGGSYDSAQNVTISCETSGASIYYTLDGTDPTDQSTEYTAAIAISETKTLKAIAVKDGMTNSEVATATYTISSGSGSGSYYTKVTSVDAIVSGNQYVIVGSTSEKNYALPANPTLNNGKISGTEIAITSNGISDADVTGLLWTLTKSGDNYSLYDGSKYLYHSNGGASGTDLGYGNTASSLWNITAAPDGSNGTFKFAGVNGTTVNTRGMLVTTAGQFGGYALTNITNSGYCGIDLYTLSDGKESADISFSPASATITYGESLTQPTLSNAHGLTVSYASSNTAVATVANGVIAVVGCGEATITCSWIEQTINNKTYRAGSATFALTVNKIAVTVAFSDPTKAVAIGSNVTNVATVTPSGLTLSYESSNTNIATVTSAGVVTGVAKGNATITATYAGDATHASASANYQITVGSANDGSQAKPFTVEEVREYMDASESNRGPVYIQGKISSINYSFDQDHGTATFFISDDGETTSDQFEAYSVKFLGNNEWVNGNTQIAVGNDVIIYGGELTIFNSSIYETKSGSGSYLYSLNGNTSETVPTITKTDITGVAAAGVSGATTTVSFANNDGWTPSVTADGTIVTSASISGTTITYTVAANTNDARTGSITVTLSKSGRTDATATISVAQLAGNGNTSTTENITSGTFTLANGELTLTLSSGVTIKQSKVSGSTAVNGDYNTVSKLRVYKGHALTFSGKTFTRIEIVVNGNYYGNNLTANTGTLTPTTTTGGTIVWEGESDNVVITNNGASGVTTQLRTTSFKVTYN